MTLRQIIEDNFGSIQKYMDPSNLLLGKLRSLAFVKDKIYFDKQQKTIDEKNEALLTALLEVPEHHQESVIGNFIKALRSSGQEHVANIIRRESEEVPMSDEHYDLLSRNIRQLSQVVDPRNGLVDRLVETGAFLTTDRTAVLRNPQLNRMVEEMVNILMRKSDCAFDKFVGVLNDTGHSHVNYLLTGVGPPPMSDQHRAVVNKQRLNLCRFVKPRDGLVDHLVSSGVLSDTDRETVVSKSEDKDAVDELVNVVLRKPDTTFDKLVDALHKSELSHVASLLTGVGPPPMSDQHRETLQSKIHELSKFVDIENGLLYRLFSRKAVSDIERDRIRSVHGDIAMVQTLVEILMRKADDVFDIFKEELRNTGQAHVIHILTGDITVDRPLKEKHRERLLSGPRDKLVEVISPGASGLVTALMSCGVFSLRDAQHVLSNRKHVMNENILNLIAKKSQSAFFNFISALDKTGQTHAALVLVGPNILVKLKAVFESREHEETVSNEDAQLVECMRQILERNKVKDLDYFLSKNDVEVTDVREGCIQITFNCRNLTALKNFQDMYKCGMLANFLNETLVPQFRDKGVESFSVEIPDEERQFQHCAEMFEIWTPMTSAHREALLSSTDWLVEKMTVSDDFLGKLPLCPRRKETVAGSATHEEQVKTLLDIISRQPDSAYRQLLNALAETQQSEAFLYLHKFDSAEANESRSELFEQNDKRDYPNALTAGQEAAEKYLSPNETCRDKLGQQYIL